VSEHDSQRQRVLRRLEMGPATSWQLGPELGVLRLSARVQELRQAGYEITWTERWEGRKRICTYRLLGQAKLWSEVA
jgi:hypothetical protein